jgi:hypothetical protein
MDARRTQINHYAQRHPAERLPLKAYLTADLAPLVSGRSDAV